MKSDGDRRNSGIELELQNIFDAMKNALGESELDSIIQNISLKDHPGAAKSGPKIPATKKKTGNDQFSSTSKEGKIMLEEVKKVRITHLSIKTFIFKKQKIFIWCINFFSTFLNQPFQLKTMNEQLIDKLETKCQLVETLERDLLEARRKVNQRKSSLENGSRKSSLAKSGDEIDPKFSQVKDAVMKEPDMEPKTSSEIGTLLVL